MNLAIWAAGITKYISFSEDVILMTNKDSHCMASEWAALLKNIKHFTIYIIGSADHYIRYLKCMNQLENICNVLVHLWLLMTLGALQVQWRPRSGTVQGTHDDVIKWKHFPRCWPFVWGIHRSPVNSPQNGQWRGALMLSLICAWINGWVNTREAVIWVTIAPIMTSL